MTAGDSNRRIRGLNFKLAGIPFPFFNRVQADRNQMAHRLIAIGAAARDLPRLDGRTDDEILGYDSDGLPT